VIKTFALNLIVGVVVGTYSSIFIASPVVLGWQKGFEKRKRQRDMQRSGGGLKPAKSETAEQEKVKRAIADEQLQVEEEKVREAARVAAAQRANPPRRKKKKKKKRR
jgi:hypothetical protein